MLGSGAHDAEKWDGRPLLDLVEDKVRSVRGHKAEVGACARQSLHPGRKIIGQIVEPPGIEHGNAFIDVEAIDEQVRISAIRLAGAVAREDGTVVVDGGLGPKPADHTCGSHAGNRCAVGTGGFESSTVQISAGS